MDGQMQMDSSLDRWTDKQMFVWMDGRLDGCIDKQTVLWMDRKATGWIDGWLDGRINRPAPPPDDEPWGHGVVGAGRRLLVGRRLAGVAGGSLATSFAET